MVTEEAPIPPCLGFMGSLWLTPKQDVAAWCLEGPHSRIAAYRARWGGMGPEAAHLYCFVAAGDSLLAKLWDRTERKAEEMWNNEGPWEP